MKSLFETIQDLITLTIFGERIPGQPVQKPTLRTIYPDNQPEENEWMQMFRVSSLHGVEQKIYFK